MNKKHIGIIANASKPDVLAVVELISGKFCQRGYTCEFDASFYTTVKKYGFQASPKWDHTPDFILALGGDGTILCASSVAASLKVPILGVNLGRIGFLSEASVKDIDEAIDRIDRGDYTLANKMMLEGSVNGGECYQCINDFQVYKRTFSGVACIHVEIDGYDTGDVFCDGFVASTPTGSTGYSISAGGPVIAPGLDVSIITPICPHSLCVRPIVASADAQIIFTMKSDGAFSADGIPIMDLVSGDTISIARSPMTVAFIQLDATRNVFALIRNKLS